MRLRENGFKCRLLSVSVRKSDLSWQSHQLKLDHATNITREIFQIGMALFHELHRWPTPIRSLGIAAGALEISDFPEQLDLFGTAAQRRTQEQLDSVMDSLRKKYGFSCIRRGLAASDLHLGGLNAREEHIVHPVGLFSAH